MLKKQEKKLDVNEEEMLEEISNFVASADFHRFYKTYIKPSKSPTDSKSNKFNRKPKLIEVKRVKSSKRERRSLAPSEVSTIKTHKHLLKPVTADIKIKSPLTIPKKVKAKIVEFT